MNKRILSIAVLAAVTLVGLAANTVEAAHSYRGFGVHIGGWNVHIDIGNPHGSYRRHTAHRYVRSYYPPRPTSRAHYDWHDTSHYDYSPAQYIRHGNHYDYVPAEVSWHQEGHCDRHYGGHRGGHH